MNEHLSQDLILRALDDELTRAEAEDCGRHLAVCESCRQATASLRELSLDIESAIETTPVPAMSSVRDTIEQAIEAKASSVVMLQNPAKVMRRYGWGVGIAAALAFGLLLAPRQDSTTLISPMVAPVSPYDAKPHSAPRQTATIDVDGEAFWPLPFSNADLATASPHIVAMQVSISSLADAGIFLEPAGNRWDAAPEGEQTVSADVLIGADGQPRGVHVLGMN